MRTPVPFCNTGATIGFKLFMQKVFKNLRLNDIRLKNNNYLTVGDAADTKGINLVFKLYPATCSRYHRL